MTKYIRYGLTTFSFAANVGCLALWGWTLKNENKVFALRCYSIHAESINGVTLMGIATEMPTNNPRARFDCKVTEIWGKPLRYFDVLLRRQGRFGMTPATINFALWYPALILALAGVASLRIGRRFTLRFSLVATAVIAALVTLPIVL